MVLHLEVSGSGPPVVFVHGFTQNGRCWGPFVEAFDAVERRVVDAPGHGRSGHAEVDLHGAARLVGEAGRRATYLGYSMGGRICLHLALERPDLVDRLVLVGATAGIDDEAERQQRIERDEALARRLETEPLDDVLDDWLALPLFEGIPTERNFRSERLTNDPAGLAASLRRCGTGTQEPLWDRLSSLTMPVLLLAGEDDTKFASIAERMAGAIGPNATVELIAGAGHAVHLERPAATAAVVADWSAT